MLSKKFFRIRNVVSSIIEAKKPVFSSRIVKKGYPLSIITMLDTNYYYNFSGSIINVRGRSFITSVKLRSRRFGAEQRFFIFAPQLKANIVSYYSLNKSKKFSSGKVGFEPTDGRPSLV